MTAIDRIKANPIVIGITGHRDLREEDISLLEKRIHELFENVRATHPNASITVLSPLAEGADRLVARIALEKEMELIVLLPMPHGEYQKDYQTQESIDEYNALISKAKQCIELPLLLGNTLENIQGFTEQRMKQYISVGAYTSAYSHILIAMWNGIDNKLPGGTADVVKYKRDGVPEGFEPQIPIADLQPVQGGMIYQIVTPRRSNLETVGQAGDVMESFYDAKRP